MNTHHGMNVCITSELGRVVGLIANKHPDCSIQIEHQDTAPEMEWLVTATDGVTDHEYVVDDECGTWAPLTDTDRRNLREHGSVFAGMRT